jgi:hypothetical protein
MIKIPSIKYTTQIPLKGKTIQVFTGPSDGPSDGHAVFMTSLRLDASFTMTPHALHNRHLAEPDTPPVLRPKSANLPPLDFEAQTGKPATFDVEA